MKIRFLTCISLVLIFTTGEAQQPRTNVDAAALILSSSKLAAKEPLRLDGLFFETANGRTMLPAQLTEGAKAIKDKPWSGEVRMPEGRTVSVNVTPQGKNFVIRLNAQPDTDAVKWGLGIDARGDEYYTGLMERVVDGPQAASW